MAILTVGWLFGKRRCRPLSFVLVLYGQYCQFLMFRLLVKIFLVAFR